MSRSVETRHLAIVRRSPGTFRVRLVEPLAVALLIVCIVAPLALYWTSVLERYPWLPVVLFVLLLPSVRISIAADGVTLSRWLGVVPFRRRKLPAGGSFECVSSSDGERPWNVGYTGATDEIWCLFPSRFATLMNREQSNLQDESRVRQ